MPARPERVANVGRINGLRIFYVKLSTRDQGPAGTNRPWRRPALSKAAHNAMFAALLHFADVDAERAKRNV